MSEFDAAASAAEKDSGIEKTLDKQDAEWRERARSMMLSYIKEHGPCLTEDAREHCLKAGLSEPSSPNAWGGVVAGMARDGVIAMSGQWAKSRAVKSHARMQPMWRAV